MRKGKLVAPIVVTVILCACFGGCAGLIWVTPGLPLWGRLAGVAIPLALAGVSVYVLIERMKEIRSGEEDDLDNY